MGYANSRTRSSAAIVIESSANKFTPIVM